MSSRNPVLDLVEADRKPILHSGKQDACQIIDEDGPEEVWDIVVNRFPSLTSQSHEAYFEPMSNVPIKQQQEFPNIVAGNSSGKFEESTPSESSEEEEILYNSAGSKKQGNNTRQRTSKDQLIFDQLSKHAEPENPQFDRQKYCEGESVFDTSACNLGNPKQQGDDGLIAKANFQFAKPKRIAKRRYFSDFSDHPIITTDSVERNSVPTLPEPVIPEPKPEPVSRPVAQRLSQSSSSSVECLSPTSTPTGAKKNSKIAPEQQQSLLAPMIIRALPSSATLVGSNTSGHTRPSLFSAQPIQIPSTKPIQTISLDRTSEPPPSSSLSKALHASKRMPALSPAQTQNSPTGHDQSLDSSEPRLLSADTPDLPSFLPQPTLANPLNLSSTSIARSTSSSNSFSRPVANPLLTTVTNATSPNRTTTNSQPVLAYSLLTPPLSHHTTPYPSASSSLANAHFSPYTPHSHNSHHHGSSQPTHTRRSGTQRSDSLDSFVIHSPRTERELKEKAELRRERRNYRNKLKAKKLAQARRESRERRAKERNNRSLHCNWCQERTARILEELQRGIRTGLDQEDPGPLVQCKGCARVWGNNGPVDSETESSGSDGELQVLGKREWKRANKEYNPPNPEKQKSKQDKSARKAEKRRLKADDKRLRKEIAQDLLSKRIPTSLFDDGNNVFVEDQTSTINLASDSRSQEKISKSLTPGSSQEPVSKAKLPPNTKFTASMLMNDRKDYTCRCTKSQCDSQLCYCVRNGTKCGTHCTCISCKNKSENKIQFDIMRALEQNYGDLEHITGVAELFQECQTNIKHKTGVDAVDKVHKTRPTHWTASSSNLAKRIN